jgi:hypothetical protein
VNFSGNEAPDGHVQLSQAVIRMPLVGAEDLKHKDLVTRDSDLILISYDLIYGLYMSLYNIFPIVPINSMIPIVPI